MTMVKDSLQRVYTEGENDQLEDEEGGFFDENVSSGEDFRKSFIPYQTIHPLELEKLLSKPIVSDNSFESAEDVDHHHVLEVDANPQSESEERDSVLDNISGTSPQADESKGGLKSLLEEKDKAELEDEALGLLNKEMNINRMNEQTETHLHREFKAETHKHGEEEETKITRESIPNQISFSLAET